MATKDITNQKLKDALRKLLSQNYIEKITVSDIVSMADISRQAFYSHYPDKYALMCDIHEEVLVKSLKKVGYEYTWEEGVLEMYRLMRMDQQFYARAFCGEGQNSIFDYHLNTVIDTYDRLIHYKNTFDAQARFALELYCLGAVSMIARWAKSGMKEDPDELVSNFFYSMPNILREALISVNSAYYPEYFGEKPQ